jgi:hypothetical protein
VNVDYAARDRTGGTLNDQRFAQVQRVEKPGWTVDARARRGGGHDGG